uniref:Regulatory protein zeste n=1 Tax=Timema bartmani TaxID=61472 RepID=A0A7R9FB55_9NEOP|nr:unnamed protein product [Timema bartmani]
MESGKPFRKKLTPVHPTEIRTYISLSSAVWLNTKLAWNRKINVATLRAKEEAWKQILQEFNSRPFVAKRNVKQIKILYENIKQKAKRHFTVGRRSKSAAKFDLVVEKLLALFKNGLESHLCDQGCENLNVPEASLETSQEVSSSSSFVLLEDEQYWCEQEDIMAMRPVKIEDWTEPTESAASDTITLRNAAPLSMASDGDSFSTIDLQPQPGLVLLRRLNSYGEQMTASTRL